jgi:hypothetical protein
MAEEKKSIELQSSDKSQKAIKDRSAREFLEGYDSKLDQKQYKKIMEIYNAEPQKRKNFFNEILPEINQDCYKRQSELPYLERCIDKIYKKLESQDAIYSIYALVKGLIDKQSIENNSYEISEKADLIFSRNGIEALENEFLNKDFMFKMNINYLRKLLSEDGLVVLRNSALRSELLQIKEPAFMYRRIDEEIRSVQMQKLNEQAAEQQSGCSIS